MALQARKTYQEAFHANSLKTAQELVALIDMIKKNLQNTVPWVDDMGIKEFEEQFFK